VRVVGACAIASEGSANAITPAMATLRKFFIR